MKLFHVYIWGVYHIIRARDIDSAISILLGDHPRHNYSTEYDKIKDQIEEIPIEGPEEIVREDCG